MGFAPTSSDLLHRAPASGLEPTMRWMWDVESTAASKAGGMLVAVVMSVEE